MEILVVAGLVLVAAVVASVVALIGYGIGRRSSSSVGPSPEPRSSPIAVERALADLRLGVVVVDEDGNDLYRNNRAKAFATGRHGNALVEAALQRLLGGALAGLSLEESVDFFGPPARSFLVQASPTTLRGAAQGAVGVIEDVTEARHNLRVRSDFVANVSHELRTPVGAMSVLAETIADTDDPEVADRLSKRMQREASRLADTIDDLLALSRLESGPVEDPETVDLAAVASLAAERSAEAAARQEVRVSVEEMRSGPALVDGDEGQLVSAVANLVDNAVKYADPGGSIVVRVGRASGPEASARVDAAGPYPAEIGQRRPAPDRQRRWGREPVIAELSVFDDGIGIPERDLERIFERFYRVDGGRSRETGGTGLGLSIVRHVALNHRGTVDVDSMEGQGSTFTLRFPLSQVERELAGDRARPAKRAGGEAAG